MANLRNIFAQHCEEDFESFDTWAEEVRVDPELIRPTEEEQHEHLVNVAAVEEHVKAHPHGLNSAQLKRVVAAKRKAEKIAWLYE